MVLGVTWLLSLECSCNWNNSDLLGSMCWHISGVIWYICLDFGTCMSSCSICITFHCDDSGIFCGCRNRSTCWVLQTSLCRVTVEIDWSIIVLTMGHDYNCLNQITWDIICWIINCTTCWCSSHIIIDWDDWIIIIIIIRVIIHGGTSCWRSRRVRESASYGFYMGMVPISAD